MVRARLLVLGLVALVAGGPAAAQSLPLVEGVEAQPLVAQTRRVAEALGYPAAGGRASRAGGRLPGIG
jgi:hypothetical protein